MRLFSLQPSLPWTGSISCTRSSNRKQNGGWMCGETSQRRPCPPWGRGSKPGEKSTHRPTSADAANLGPLSRQVRRVICYVWTVLCVWLPSSYCFLVVLVHLTFKFTSPQPTIVFQSSLSSHVVEASTPQRRKNIVVGTIVFGDTRFSERVGTTSFNCSSDTCAARRIVKIYSASNCTCIFHSHRQFLR